MELGTFIVVVTVSLQKISTRTKLPKLRLEIVFSYDNNNMVSTKPHKQ
jgi:hypothetical protein